MTRSHTHPCLYCETPLRCTGDPVYADGYEGAFCEEEATHGCFVCDDCAEIVWCGVCGDIECLPGEGVCAACWEDDPTGVQS